MRISATWRYLGSVAQIDAALEGLTRVAEVQLRESAERGRPIPPLMQSGVRYRAEPPGQEVWCTPLECLRQGHGDCEDLAAWLAAEYRAAGIRARAGCYAPRPGLVHCVVYVERGGRIARVDPSRELGMGGKL